MRRVIRTRWRRADGRGRRAPGSCRGLVWGNPNRTPGKEKQASSVSACGGPTRPKKPVRRCFKLRPPWRAGFAGFASGCRLLSGSGVATWMPAVGIHPCDHRSFKTPGGCPAVDRMPTNRHAATGTCEIGRAGYTGGAAGRQGSFPACPRNFDALPECCCRIAAPMPAGLPKAGASGHLLMIPCRSGCRPGAGSGLRGKMSPCHP